MSNAFLPSLILLPLLIFTATSQAEETPAEPDLSLKLDYQLSQELPALTERNTMQASQPPAQTKPVQASPISSDQQLASSGYQLGQGWRYGNYYFSGYTNIEFVAHIGQPAEVAVDDLSIFAGGNVSNWFNPFLEAEISGYTVLEQGGGPRGNGYFVLERLYNDSMLSEHDTLRLGKILSPVGNWNLIHAAPLVPTNTRPMTTFHGFSEYTTAVSWLHDPENGVSPDWHLYWQPGTEFPKRHKDLTPRLYRNVLGAHINMPLGLIDKAGASFQHGTRIETGETYTLYGANLTKTFGKLRLESEAITSRWSGNGARAHDQESGIFGLLDYTFAHGWHGILEWERYQDYEVAQPSRNILAGVSYKSSPVVLKLEYVRQTGESQFISSGWQASFSTLF